MLLLYRFCAGVKFNAAFLLKKLMALSAMLYLAETFLL
jgi:hypothetical protein